MRRAARAGRSASLIARSVPPIVLGLAVAYCQGRGSTSRRSSDEAGVSLSTRSESPLHPLAMSAGHIDALGTIYPTDGPGHSLATRLCDALHTLPARRKAECCGGDPAPFLATACARVLAATLHAQTVELDEASVERCASTMTGALAGCEWVTPGPAPAPEACQGLLRGKLERGSVCRSSLECAGDMHCDGVSPTRTGMCAPPGGDGTGCGSHVDVLATYLFDRQLANAHPFCAEHCSMAAHQCGPRPKVGSACVANVSCAPSQICVSGRCSAAAPSARGEPCGAVPCAEGLRCMDKVCAPLAKSGEPCTADVACARGGCVRGGDGRGTCGAQCSASLAALRGGDGGVTMRLPVMPRSGSGKR